MFSYNLYVPARDCPSLFCLCRLCNIFYRNAFACIQYIVLRLRIRQLDTPYKSVIYNYSLSSAFAGTFCFKHINVVNKFSKKRCGKLIHLHKSALKNLCSFSISLSFFCNSNRAKFSSSCFNAQTSCLSCDFTTISIASARR